MNMGADLFLRDEFERVAMPHTESLLRAALRLVQDRAVAEDIVQETLLSGWKSFNQFERGTNCKAWLFRIMLNLVSKRRQKLKTTPPMVSLESNDSSVVVPIRPAAPNFNSLEIFGALDTLSEEHRIVLLLRVVEGFTCKEISLMCGVPIGTVMSRISRARAELRDRLLNSKSNGQSSANAG